MAISLSAVVCCVHAWCVCVCVCVCVTRLAASMCGCLKKLDAGTRDAMEKSLEASLGGEDYAEWLHYKEVGRVKKDGWEQQGAKEMEEAEDGDDVVDLMVDSKEDTAWTHTRNNGWFHIVHTVANASSFSTV